MQVASMTGFGRGYVEREGRKLMLELKGVNHRFLDISMRLPKSFGPMEEKLKRRLQEKLSRGHVDVYLKYQNEAEGSKTVSVDEALLNAYLSSLKGIRKRHNLKDDVALSTVLRMPDVIAEEGAEEDEDLLTEIMLEAADLALAEMARMRASEGERLKADLLIKLEGMTKEMSDIERRAPAVVQEYRDKLRARIVDLMEGNQPDEQRLAAEVALMADRISIDEEVVRFRSHVKHFADTLKSGGAIGRKLDFIVQEMNREVNTICSKAADMAVINSAIALKGEIEKLREQVQNIE
jgi:uncharacterized protein (TIGR00255 family)